MRTININIYQYNELSEAAKEKAFEAWQGDGFAECFELRPILKQLDNDYNLALSNWDYDSYNYHYKLKNGSFDNSGRYEYDIEWGELTGKTALKKAMRLYDELTLMGVYFTPYGKTYYKRDICRLSRIEQMRVHEIDGTYLGYDFTDGLKQAIASKNLNLSYADYIEAAFDALFQAAVDDAEYQASEQCFVENYAFDNEYLENGDVYNV